MFAALFFFFSLFCSPFLSMGLASMRFNSADLLPSWDMQTCIDQASKSAGPAQKRCDCKEVQTKDNYCMRQCGGFCLVQPLSQELLLQWHRHDHDEDGRSRDRGVAQREHDSP